MLTNQKTEKLLRLIASGKNTYADTKHVFPSDWPDRYIYIADEFKRGCFFVGLPPKKIGLIEFENVPDDYSRNYQFKDTDTFRLTVVGQNIHDRNEKEKLMLYLTGIAAAGGVVVILDTILKIYKQW